MNFRAQCVICFVITTMTGLNLASWHDGGASSSSSSRSSSSSDNPCSDIRIISRSEWGARSPTSVSYLNHPASYAFVHHTTGSSCTSESACKSQVRGIQNYHMDSNDWSDIGYSFLVGCDGNIYEGRGWDRQGAHTRGYNSNGLAWAYIGDFTNKLPSSAAMEAGKKAIACGVQLGKLSTSYQLKGHRDVGSTECPGTTLYNKIRSWPNYQN